MPVIVKNTNNLEYSYQEPTTNANGTPLTDLKETRAYVRVLPSGVGSVVKIESAQSPNGGREVVVSAVAPVIAGEEKDLECWVAAVDIAGNISAQSNIVQVRVDMLAPAPPLL